MASIRLTRILVAREAAAIHPSLHNGRPVVAATRQVRAVRCPVDDCDCEATTLASPSLPPATAAGPVVRRGRPW